MKRTLVMGLLSIGLFLLTIRAHSDDTRTETLLLPPQISDFYDNYNFISSFSTGAERRMLIEKYSRYGIPEDMETERLGKVFNRMKRLEDRFFVMDSKMVIWVGPTPKFWKFHFHPVLFDVLGIHFSGDKAVVDVVSYHVEPETILRFISAFEESEGDGHKVPSPEERILLAKCGDPEEVFHRWVLQNGNWKKSTADLYPLREKRH